MHTHHTRRHLFYLLAAIVLLLQSFAVWHDAEHPFHTADLQCERLDAISHLPGLDTVADVPVLRAYLSHFVAPPASLAVLPNRQRSQHAIRAPPTHS